MKPVIAHSTDTPSLLILEIPIRNWNGERLLTFIKAPLYIRNTYKELKQMSRQLSGKCQCKY